MIVKEYNANLNMCCSIFMNFIPFKSEVKPSATQVSSDWVMVRSECDVNFISRNDPISCIWFLPNKKIVNHLNTKRLVWNCNYI